MPKIESSASSTRLVTRSRPSKSRRFALSIAAFVFLAGVVWAIYGRAFDSAFIFDDIFSIERNPSIVKLWPLMGDSEQPGPLNPPRDLPTAGRPLVNLSLALNYHFGELSPVSYHVFNLVVHLLSALLFYAIVRRTLRLEYFGGRFDGVAEWLALAAALLWAVHPLQTETVIYVTQRTELLVGFFYLATLYGSLRYWVAASPGDQKTWLVLSSLACLAGMASKEVMVTAPLVVLLFERTFLAGSFRQALRKSWRLYVGLALGWALLLALNYNGPRANSAGFDHNVPAYAWWLTQTKVLWMYLKLVVWPWPLTIHYELPYLTSPAAAWPWLLPTAFLMLAAFVLWWRRNPIGFVGAWVLVILSPTLVVPIVTEVAAERRMYLPLAALAALAVAGGYALARQIAGQLADKGGKVPHWWPPALAAIALVLAVVLSLVSVHRLAAYHDPVTLWQDTLATQANDSTAHNNLAVALNQADRFEEAIEHASQALLLDPNHAEARNNLGIALFNTGRLQEAIEQYQYALLLKPDDAQLHSNLGIVLFKLNRVQEAIAHYRRALQLNPENAEAHNNLGLALADTERTQEAIDQYQQALEIVHNFPDALYNLANTLLKTGQTDRAQELFQKTIQLAPDHFEAHNNLGALFLKANQLEKALEQFEQAVRIKPESPGAHNNLGNALILKGRPEEAIQHYQQAVTLEPNYFDAYSNLANAYAQLRRSEDAIATAQKALDLARAQKQTALADKIEAWLTKYRSQSAGPQGASRQPGSAQPAP